MEGYSTRRRAGAGANRGPAGGGTNQGPQRPQAQACPFCGQAYHSQRFGIDLTPLKARILDVVKAAGEIGISKRELHYDIYRDRPHQRGNDTVRVHLHQINDMLESTDWVLVAEGHGRLARWFLRKRRIR